MVTLLSEKNTSRKKERVGIAPSSDCPPRLSTNMRKRLTAVCFEPFANKTAFNPCSRTEQWGDINSKKRNNVQTHGVHIYTNEAHFDLVFWKHHLKIKGSQINKHSIVALIAPRSSYRSCFTSALSNGSVQSLVHLSVRRKPFHRGSLRSLLIQDGSLNIFFHHIWTKPQG